MSKILHVTLTYSYCAGLNIKHIMYVFILHANINKQ